MIDPVVPVWMPGFLFWVCLAAGIVFILTGLAMTSMARHTLWHATWTSAISMAVGSVLLWLTGIDLIAVWTLITAAFWVLLLASFRWLGRRTGELNGQL